MTLWPHLFRSEKARTKPVLMEDVGTAEVPNKDLARQHDLMLLKLIKSAYTAAELSGRIRESVAQQVALNIQGRG